MKPAPGVESRGNGGAYRSQTGRSFKESPGIGGEFGWPSNQRPFPFPMRSHPRFCVAVDVNAI